jgi:hypothetical protein
MKQLLFLFLLCPVIAFAQALEYGSFKIEETEIVYQKIFNADGITAEKLVEFFNTVPELKNAAIADGSVTADLTELTVDYKKFKFSQVGTPPIIQTGRYSGKVVADVKDGRYRITIRSFQMKGDIGYKRILQPEPMTNYACSNSGTILARDWCKPNMLGMLEQAITDKFNYKDPSKGSDW